jgi:hypothetical protein
MPNKKIFFFIIFYSSYVFAAEPLVERNASEEKSKDLILALKFAGVKPHKFNTTLEYSLNSLVCHTANAYSDGLMTYRCQLDKNSEIQGASAKVLYDALIGLKIPVDAAMSQTWVRVGHVHCRIELTMQPPNYICHFLNLNFEKNQVT